MPLKSAPKAFSKKPGSGSEAAAGFARTNVFGLAFTTAAGLPNIPNMTEEDAETLQAAPLYADSDDALQTFVTRVEAARRQGQRLVFLRQGENEAVPTFADDTTSEQILDFLKACREARRSREAGEANGGTVDIALARGRAHTDATGAAGLDEEK